MIYITTKKKNQSGQAIFEFIVFMPFLLMVLASMIVIGSAINGAINQQKVTRGYFFAKSLNSSNLIEPELLNKLQEKGMLKVGSYTIGWADYLDGDNPVAICYDLPSLLTKTDSGETCDTRPPGMDETKSKYVRVRTAFGICGASYDIGGQNKFSPDFRLAGALGGCLLIGN